MDDNFNIIAEVKGKAYLTELKGSANTIYKVVATDPKLDRVIEFLADQPLGQTKLITTPEKFELLMRDIDAKAEYYNSTFHHIIENPLKPSDRFFITMNKDIGLEYKGEIKNPHYLDRDTFTLQPINLSDYQKEFDLINKESLFHYNIETMRYEPNLKLKIWK